MERKVKIGVIGCGVISEIYCRNIKAYFKELEIEGCADLVEENAAALAQKFDIPHVYSVEELLADESIELVLNLTIPAEHERVSCRILEAGKHVYSEKPLAITLEGAQRILQLAERKKKMVCAAPETVLGAGLTTGKQVLCSGRIGRPVAVTVNMMTHGVETWHRNPAFYYQKGAGPMMDMGPYYFAALVYLLGPVEKIFCLSNRGLDNREIYSEPHRGQMLKVEVDTNYMGVVTFASGAVANVNMSFEAWRSQLPQFEIYGTEGVLRLPDPNTFGGPVSVLLGKDMLAETGIAYGNEGKDCRKLWQSVELLPGYPQQNARGIAVHEMALSILAGEKRCLDESFVYHVTEAVLGAVISGETGQIYEMKSTYGRQKK